LQNAEKERMLLRYEILGFCNIGARNVDTVDEEMSEWYDM